MHRGLPPLYVTIATPPSSHWRKTDVCLAVHTYIEVGRVYSLAVGWSKAAATIRAIFS